MRRRLQEPETQSNHERWMLTYVDLITLLMIFFIIMYTISNVNAKKFSQLSASLNHAFVGEATGVFVGEAPGPSMITGISGSKNEQNNMQEARAEIERYIRDHGLQGKVTVTLEERGLIISLKEVLLFDSGSDSVKPQAKATIASVGKIIGVLPNSLRVEGNTDNLPIHTSNFPSNWVLSVSRAINVVEFLIDNSGIKPERLSVVGYGEYRPIVPNDTENNRAKNRRVDIVVLKQALNLSEAGNSQS